LEEKLVLLQSIIKSDQPSSEGAYLLSEIQALLDELFEYLMETRPDYDVHVLTSADDIVSTLIGLPQDDVRMTCTHSGNMEECISWLSSNDTDLIILDDQDPVMPEQLSSELESLCIEIPILVVMDQHVSKLLERFNDIVNINGAVIKSTPISQLLEVIKTIVNGRNFFQQKGKKQSE
jgi:DNA-binding NarL/FixJ family response regulator